MPLVGSVFEVSLSTSAGGAEAGAVVSAGVSSRGVVGECGGVEGLAMLPKCLCCVSVHVVLSALWGRATKSISS